jgi:hypothetical protein
MYRSGQQMGRKSSGEVMAATRTKPTAATPHKAFRIADLVRSGPLGRTAIFEAIRTGKLRAKKYGSATFVLADDWAFFLESAPDARAA